MSFIGHAIKILPNVLHAEVLPGPAFNIIHNADLTTNCIAACELQGMACSNVRLTCNATAHACQLNVFSKAHRSLQALPQDLLHMCQMFIEKI